MKRIEILKEYYEREMNNVFCYSANYLMNSAKKGYEREFEAAVMKADTLREMIEEEERKNEAVEIREWVAKEPEPVEA